MWLVANHYKTWKITNTLNKIIYNWIKLHKHFKAAPKDLWQLVLVILKYESLQPCAQHLQFITLSSDYKYHNIQIYWCWLYLLRYAMHHACYLVNQLPNKSLLYSLKMKLVRYLISCCQNVWLWYHHGILKTDLPCLTWFNDTLKNNVTWFVVPLMCAAHAKYILQMAPSKQSFFHNTKFAQVTLRATV